LLLASVGSGSTLNSGRERHGVGEGMNEVGVKGDRGGLVAGVEWQRGVLSCAECVGKWRFYNGLEGLSKLC
jgi:hypothetical protein